MDRFESRMTPSYLAESETGMLWEPRVIKSRRETVEGLKEDENGKRRASVLSSLSLSWFSVIHVFMSVQALSSLVRLVTSLRGADFWSCVSSTKSRWFTEWLAMIPERGVVYRTKRMGPSTEPWGTPYMSCDGEEDELLTEVDWYLSEKYDWNHWSAVDWMPKTEFRREMRMLWSVVSKAAERSSKRRMEMSLSRAERISCTTQNSLCAVFCSLGWLKGVAEVVFLEMGEKFVENNSFKDFGQKQKVRNGAVVFQKIFVRWWHFQKRFDDGCLHITWYNASGKRCVDDVHYGRQEDVKVFTKKHGGNGIKFTRLGRWTADDL